MLRFLLMSAMIGLITTGMEAKVTVEKTEYKGWTNCYRVSNGEIEAVVTADVGPRIIRFGFVGGQNLFKEYPEQLGKSGEKSFQLRGGDRVWKAPEDQASWAPDNVAVAVEVTPAGLIARAPVDPATGLQKEIEIRMASTGTQVTVLHRITNRSASAMEFTAWALTMMAQGGTAVSAFPPRGTHPENLAPTNPLVMWAYTDLSDPRLKFTKKYLMLRQDPNNSQAQKLGMFNGDTWAAYVLHGEAFVKRTSSDPTKRYPDFGSSFEIFTNNEFLEVETLGPLSQVNPGQTVEQEEHWGLFRNVVLSVRDEELDHVLLPLVHSLENVR